MIDLWKTCKVLPSDYRDYGGEIIRWQDETIDYPDCSCGCRFWIPLYDAGREMWDTDWGVCANPDSPRAGLLTWEHQAGFNCFKKSLDTHE